MTRTRDERVFDPKVPERLFVLSTAIERMFAKRATVRYRVRRTFVRTHGTSLRSSLAAEGRLDTTPVHRELP